MDENRAPPPIAQLQSIHERLSVILSPMLIELCLCVCVCWPILFTVFSYFIDPNKQQHEFIYKFVLLFALVDSIPTRIHPSPKGPKETVRDGLQLVSRRSCSQMTAEHCFLSLSLSHTQVVSKGNVMRLYKIVLLLLLLLLLLIDARESGEYKKLRKNNVSATPAWIQTSRSDLRLFGLRRSFSSSSIGPPLLLLPKQQTNLTNEMRENKMK